MLARPGGQLAPGASPADEHLYFQFYRQLCFPVTIHLQVQFLILTENQRQQGRTSDSPCDQYTTAPHGSLHALGNL